MHFWALSVVAFVSVGVGAAPKCKPKDEHGHGGDTHQPSPTPSAASLFSNGGGGTTPGGNNYPPPAGTPTPTPTPSSGGAGLPSYGSPASTPTPSNGGGGGGSKTLTGGGADAASSPKPTAGSSSSAGDDDGFKFHTVTDTPGEPVSIAGGKATTTSYYDGNKGACGCGVNGQALPWQSNTGVDGWYTAAGSDALFGPGSIWLGQGCGQCYELTSTGSAPAGQGRAAPVGTKINVMITNWCPHKDNTQWCPEPGGTNQYGMQYHFDVMLNPLGKLHDNTVWDNPIVDFKQISCKPLEHFYKDTCRNPS